MGNQQVCCIAQETLLSIIWQAEWEGNLGENGYMHMSPGRGITPGGAPLRGEPGAPGN